MAAAGSQATVQGSFGLVTLISALTNNMGGPTTNTGCTTAADTTDATSDNNTHHEQLSWKLNYASELMQPYRAFFWEKACHS